MLQDSFEVIGGHQLSGEIIPQGAKNEALQVLCAILLTNEKITISNIPNIRDVNRLIELLKGLNVKIQQIDKNTCSFQANEIDLDYFESKEFQDNARKIRGSVMLIGPLLARFGKAFLPQPGGDKIGRRRLDTHFLGLEKLGGKFRYDDHKNVYFIESEKLQGVHILMEEISVTGTANIVMAACFGERNNTNLQCSL